MAFEKTCNDIKKDVEPIAGHDIFLHAPIGIFTSTPEGRYLAANPALAAIFGYESPEALLAGVSDIASQTYADPEDRARAMLLLERDGEIVNYECRRLRRDGTVIWVSMNVRAVRDADGKTLQHQGFTTDITERKRSEEALRQSEERSRLLSDLTMEGIVVHRKGVSIDMNEAMARMLNSTRADLLETNFLDNIHPDDLALVHENMAKAKASPYEIRMVRKGGDVFFAEIEAYDFPMHGETWRVAAVRDITERKRSEEALRASETRLQNLFESMPNGYYRSTPQGRFVEVNPAYVRMLGYESKEELLQLNISRDVYVRPEERGAYLRANRNSEFLELSHSEYYRLRTKDGRIIHVEDQARYIRNERGEVIFHEGICRDITERKRAEEALRASELKLRIIFENSPLGMVYFDKSGTIVECNEKFVELMGSSREKLIGFNTASQSTPKMREAIAKALNGEPAVYEDSYTSVTGGRTLSLRVVFNPVRLGSENTEVIATLEDISERKVAEERLKESELRFKALHNASFGGICIHDKGVILDCNQGLSDITGYTVEELIGMDGLLLTAERFRAEAMDKILSGYEKPYEVTAVRKNGEEYPARLEARCIPYKGRQVRVVEFRDITQRKQTEEALRAAKEAAEAANRTKSMFLANMSHELRTPLNGIQGMIQLMQGTELSREQQEYAALAVESTKRLTCLLSDILDISRIEAGRMPILREPFDFEEALLSLRQIFQPSARQLGNKLEFHISPEIPKLLAGDSLRLQQVVSNLVGNALKFTRNGSVTLEAYPLPSSDPDACRVLFNVTDTGSGIPDDKQAGLFEPFTQVDEGTTRSCQGAGLGLHICKRLLELMGGHITLDSELGRGTSVYFCVTFGKLPPLAATEPPADDEAAEEAASPCNILLAEDCPVNQLAVRRFLEKQGHRVTAVDNGLRAIEALADDHFDIVFMDIQMPIMNGIKATRAIRNGLAGKDRSGVPVVALTAYAMVGDRERFLEAGMDDYLAKPVDMKALGRMVRKMLRKQKLRKH
ncbi:PAS domain S-box protein [Paucidesulfovibrio longus]|uniref:PAS domain S-box protein n=1 Tax=Paucidesulfovibrio longus TaxID=889 RepID=UPI0003B3B93E|nr:PAS domain S-box protein [Paucidesulfovibrio longus]